MFLAIIHHLYIILVDGRAVQRHAGGAFFADQMVAARAKGHGQPRAGPIPQQGAQAHTTAPALVAQQLQHADDHPRRGAGVPGPAAAPDHPGAVVHVRGHRIGLHPIGRNLLRAVRVVHRQQHLKRPVGPAGIAPADQRQQQPQRPVGVLAAVLPDPRRIAADIAGIDAAPVEGRGQQADEAVFLVRQLFPGRVQRHATAGSVQAAEHRPGLGDAVDLALCARRAAQGRAVVGIGPQVPAAVPAVHLQGYFEPPRQLLQPVPVLRVRGDLPIGVGAGRCELGQPHALPLPRRADLIHAVVPVPRSNQQKAVAAGPRSPLERPHAVAVEGVPGRAGAHVPVHVPLPLRDLHVLQIGHDLLQDRPVPGEGHVGRRRIGQEQHIVRDARAHAGIGRVPPVQHVPRLELPRRTAKQVRPRPFGLRVHQRQHVLQLVPKAPGSAGLVEPGAAQHPAGADLVEQEAVEQKVQALVGRVDFRGDRQHLPGQFSPVPKGVHPGLGRADILRPAQRQPHRRPLPPPQVQRHGQRPSLAPARRVQTPARRQAAPRPRLGSRVQRRQPAHARAGARGKARAAHVPCVQRDPIPRIRAHQPVHAGDQPQLLAPQVPVLQRQFDADLRALSRHEEGGRARHPPRREGIGNLPRAIAGAEGQRRTRSRQQRQHGPALVRQVQHQPPALPEGVAGPGRQPVHAAVARPEAPAAPLREQLAASVVGQEVAPGRGRQVAAAQVDGVMAVRQEAAQAVVQRLGDGPQHGRAGEHRLRRLPHRAVQVGQQRPDLIRQIPAAGEGR